MLQAFQGVLILALAVSFAFAGWGVAGRHQRAAITAAATAVAVIAMSLAGSILNLGLVSFADQSGEQARVAMAVAVGNAENLMYLCFAGAISLVISGMAVHMTRQE